MNELLSTYFQQTIIFVLVLTRVSGLVLTLPVFGSTGVPLQVRALLSITISLLLTPLFWGQRTSDVQSLVELSAMMGREAMLGLSLGVAVLILLSGMQLAGQIISQMSGLSLANVVNPTFDEEVPVFSQLLEMVALAVFLSLGGDRMVMDALLRSFEWMPPGAGNLPTSLPAILGEIASQSFDTGIRAAAPVMASLLVSTAVVALIGRALPQINALAMGMNLSTMVALVVMGLSLGSAALVFESQVAGVIDKVQSAFADPAAETYSDMEIVPE